MADKFNFDRVIKNFERIKKGGLPKKVAAVTREHFMENFADEAFDGKKWMDVQRKRKNGSSRNQSKILVQSGRLRRAVNNSLRIATFTLIHFKVTEVPYAAVHNDGLRAGRGAGFIMPRRRFMGQDQKLTGKQRKTITNFVDKIWK